MVDDTGLVKKNMVTGKVRRFDVWTEVMRLVTDARGKGEVITNFFPDEKRMSRWCRNGAFFCMQNEETTFFMRRQETFLSLYFLAKSAEALLRDVLTFVKTHKKIKTVVDVVELDESRCPLEAAFKNAGFTVLTTLRRMSRKTPDGQEKTVYGVEAAQVQDAESILNLLNLHFVAEEEQLPDMEEIHAWMEARHVLVSREESNGEINGFVIFDLFPAALYLRYWFVIPSARDKGIGGKLMQAMFAAGANTKRQYFWVKEDNENAIACYRHYGFEFEALKDTVLAYEACRM